MLARLLRTCALFLLAISAQTMSVSAMIVESGDSVVIDSATSQDIYCMAGTLVINAPVKGQIVAAGGKIFINDTVNDIFVAGGSVQINGYVIGRIHCFGGRLHISHNIGGDLAAAGGEILIDRNASIQGDLLMAAGTLTIYGAVQGYIRAATGKFALYGSAGRGLDCRARNILIEGTVAGPTQLAASDELTIGTNAAFDSAVRYWAPYTVNFGTAGKPGQYFFDENLAIGQSHWYLLGYTSWLPFVCYLASALLTIILLQYLFPHLFLTAGNKAYDNSLRSFGAGLLICLATPIAIFLCFISLIGILIGLGLLMTYIFAFLICGCVAALVAAHWVSNLADDAPTSFWRRVWIAFAFYIGLKLLLSIPLFGWILFPIVVLTAFGALITSIKWKKASRSHPFSIAQRPRQSL